MAMPKVLEDNERGQTRVEGNAFCQDSKIQDAAEARVGSPSGPGSGGGGKYSFDVLPNGVSGPRREIASMMAGEGAYGAEWKLVLLKKGGQTTDADQITVIQATAAELEFLVPVKGLTTGTGESHPVRMWAPNGLSFTQQQDDGNFVTYTTTVAFSVAPEHVKAVWSAWTGRIG